MTTQDLPLMQAAISKMHWHEVRQRVLAQNIANAEVPGYQAQDVVPLNFKGLLESSASKLSLSAVATNPKHLSSGGASGSAGQPVIKKQKISYDAAGPTDSTVAVEEQLLKMNESYTDHRLAAAIYQKNTDMMKRATRAQ